jgi:hypothetical protein
MACGTPVNPVEMAMAAEDHYPIHLKCVQARHRAVLRHKCVCRTRKYAVRKGAAPGQRGRAWLSCERCLGQIEQLQ